MNKQLWLPLVARRTQCSGTGARYNHGVPLSGECSRRIKSNQPNEVRAQSRRDESKLCHIHDGKEQESVWKETAANNELTVPSYIEQWVRGPGISFLLPYGKELLGFGPREALPYVACRDKTHNGSETKERAPGQEAFSS